MKSVQGRLLLTSICRSSSRRQVQPTYRPTLVPEDPFGRPMPSHRVMETIECIGKLQDREKKKYGFLFSELLGLPNPPKIATQVPGANFLVKLLKFDAARKTRVLREVAWVKSTEEVTSLECLGLIDSVEILANVPSVVKQGVTKEEANEIIAKINAAGGVAVMESME